MRQINKLFQIFLVFTILSACTTQKSREDLSFIGKAYHNTTAHFNGYFNANELVMLSTEMLKEQHQDNYNKTLDIFEYISADNPQAVAGNLDEAIKKVSLVVNLHRQSDWTDDCYLIVGKAQFLKQDYEAAEETMRYFVNEFDPSNPASRKKTSKSSKSKKGKKSSSKSKSSKKKKASSSSKNKKSKSAAQKRKEYNRQVKKNKKRRAKSSGKKTSTPKPPTPEVSTPEPTITTTDDELNPAIEEKKEKANNEPNNYFMKHRPAFQEGVLWLAKTLIERDNYDGAMRYMNKLENMPNLFKDVEKDLAVVQAYYYYKQRDYNQTIAYLEKALEMATKQDPKARYAYIIAQLHQKAGRGDKAYAAFEKVLKNGPDYEMAFSSKVNMAQNAYLSGKGSSEDAKRNLERMLKDTKNEPYKDQVYFALGQIALKEGNREEAIKNLELSLKNSRQNRSQKAESYLTLATLYFETEEYVPAKNYYDSTLQVLAQTDERYNEVQGYSTNLTEIAKNLETIQLQDSLLKIGNLSEAEKLSMASEIKRQEDEKRRKQLEAKNNAANSRSATSRALPGGGGALKVESNFFAYDDKKIKRGKRDFQREWSGRSLEDDWRRSNRRSSTEIEEEEVLTNVDSPLTQDEVDKILRGVPKNDDDRAKANLQIREAMFSLGSLYRERLDNNEKAIEILEELNRRYPGSNYELDSWYFLYLAHTDENNNTKAREYFDKIVEKYPSSTYAMVLKDPDYANKILDEERKLNNYYDDAYSAFTSGRYQEAFEKSSSAKEKFGAANALQPRFALLTAMSTGSLQGQDAYINALKEVVAKYPNTDENRRAKEILRLLGITTAQLPGQEEEESAEFTIEDDKLHYMLVVFSGEGTSLTDAKATVSDYNRQYHRLDKLRISNIYLGTDVRTPIIVIRRFKDKAEAMRYYKGIENNRSDFIDRSIPHEIFAVTQNNYRQILRSKSTAGYRAFFEANYLND